MNRPFTFGGQLATTREGVDLLEPADGALNQSLGASITLARIEAGGGAETRELRLILAAPMSAEVDAMEMLFIGRGIAHPFRMSDLTAMKAGAGVHVLSGDEAAFLGPLIGAGERELRVAMNLHNADGWVLVRDLWALTADSPIAAAPSFGSVTLSGNGVAGSELTATANGVTGFPAPTLAFQWLDSGTPIGGATSSAYTPPSAGAVISCRVTATNSEGSAELTSDPITIVAGGAAPVISSAAISGNGFIGSPHAVSYTVTGDPAPSVALKWQLDGANISGETGASYIPTTGGTLSCEIAATNVNGSASAEPTITISALLALTAAQWNITTIEAVGTTARRMKEIWIDPAVGATRTWWSTASPEALAVNPRPLGLVEMTVIDAEAGLWDPGIAYNISVAPGTGNIGDGTVSGDSSVIGPATITLTATSATEFTVSGAATGTATVGTEFASGGRRFIVLAGSTPFQSGDTFTLQVGDRDFAVFDPSPPGAQTSDNLRQARVCAFYAIDGSPISLVSEHVKTVPLLPNTVVNAWYPFMGRSAQQFADGFIGGDGRQNFKFTARSAANPDSVWWGLDVNGPVCSDNAGGWYRSPPLRGMKVNECGAGLWIDPGDANRVIIGASAADLRSSTTTPNAYDLAAGLYLSLDNGETATHVLQLTNVRSCGASGERDNMQLLVSMSGGTPATRTVFYAFKPRPKGGAWGTGRLYRSTDGGATWAAFGESLTNAKFGEKVYWIDRDPNDNLFLGCDAGLFKSTNGGSSWTACTGIAGPVTVVNAYHGGTDIWAVRQGNGIYQATNAAGTTYARNSALGAYNARFVAVCPSDPQRIIAAESGAGNKGKWTGNGGSSWATMIHQNYEGQTADWSTWFCDQTALASWTPGSTTEIVMQLKQRFGKSDDAGRNTHDSSNGTDYRTRRGLGVDPDDWQVMISGMTDVGGSFSDNGLQTDQNCKLTGAQRTTAIGGSHHLAGSGALILKNGSHRAYIIGVGGSATQITPMRFTFDGTIGSGEFVDSSKRGGEISGRDHTDAAVGWLGNSRLKLSAGNALSIDKVMDQHFFGASGTSMRIFGGDKSGSSKDIYLSPNGGDTWAPWGASPVRYRHIAGSPYAIEASRHAANRVWVGEAHNGTGRVFRMEGAVPANTLVFTLADFPGFDAPATEIHRVKECPSDPTIIYVLAFASGNPILFRIRDALTMPVVEDITANAPRRAFSWLYVHDLTDDVIIGGQMGSRILRCHTGSTAPDAGKLFDRTKAYVDANLGVGVEL